MEIEQTTIVLLRSILKLLKLPAVETNNLLKDILIELKLLNELLSSNIENDETGNA